MEHPNDSKSHESKIQNVSICFNDCLIVKIHCKIHETIWNIPMIVNPMRVKSQMFQYVSMIV